MVILKRHAQIRKQPDQTQKVHSPAINRRLVAAKELLIHKRVTGAAAPVAALLVNRIMEIMLRYVVVLFVVVAGTTGCQRAPETAQRPRTAQLTIGQQMFKLDLALDPASRRNGLGGRRSIGPREGVLLVLPRPMITAVVARDCYVPLDVAFLDADGQILRAYTISPEPPRRSEETNAEYEARLPTYSSHFPVWFVLEVAGGRLTELGVIPGHNFDLNWKALTRRAS